MMAAGGARSAAGMPRQMSRQLSIRTAPGAQLHGKAAQVGWLPPCILWTVAGSQAASLLILRISIPSILHVWQCCTLHVNKSLKQCGWNQGWDNAVKLSAFFSPDTCHRVHDAWAVKTGVCLQSQLLLSIFMEFWLSDGDCPLPGTGERSLPDTPKKPGDAWQDFNDTWGGLLAAPQTSLR